MLKAIAELVGHVGTSISEIELDGQFNETVTVRDLLSFYGYADITMDALDCLVLGYPHKHFS